MASSSVGKVIGILAVIAISIAVIGTVGGAYALGLGPFSGASDGEVGTPTTTPEATATPEATTAPEETTAPVPTDAEATQSGEETAENRPPFAFEIVDVEECGSTCRDVTATLYNNQEQPASNVAVDTHIYAGNSTDEGDRVWSGEEEIGNMEAGGSDTREQRVELSTMEAFAVQRNDGWITIHVTVRSEERTVSFEERRNVL